MEESGGCGRLGGQEGRHSRVLLVTGVAANPHRFRLFPALVARLLLDAGASRTFAADGHVVGAAVVRRRPFLAPADSAT